VLKIKPYEQYGYSEPANNVVIFASPLNKEHTFANFAFPGNRQSALRYVCSMRKKGARHPKRGMEHA
jgi:hypothetical protein